jgi:hypothetical protein
MKNIRLIGVFTIIASALISIIFFLETPETPKASLYHDIRKKVANATPVPEARASDFPSVDIPKREPVPLLSTPPQATNEPLFEVDSANSSLRSSDIVVPHGARVPAVLMDGGAPNDSPQVRQVMDGIVEDFQESLKEAQQTNRNMREAWEEAREAADDRYKFFFGFEAFNAATLETATEALEETKSTPNTPGQR